MIQQESGGRFVARQDGPTRWEVGDASLGELLKRLSADMGNLVSQEAKLAKAELKESASTAAKAGVKLGIALTLAMAGSIALTAAIIVAAGAAFDNYWIPALIVGGIELAIGATMARGAVSSFKGSEMKPAETLDTLRESKAWAAREARELKQSIAPGNSPANAAR